MSQKITPAKITKLKKNEIFVFGSNLLGNHAGGAALIAVKSFGAINGQGIGLQGKSYALPTLTESMEKVTLEDLQIYIDSLQLFALNNPSLHFLITGVGCGIAGFTHAEVAPLFKKYVGIENFSLPQAFIDILVAPVKGFKVTNSDMTCNPDGIPFQFELGKRFNVEGEIIPCRNGFHYCQVLSDCFGYYNFDPNNRVFEIIDHGDTKTEGNKSCTSEIEFVRELSWAEVLDLVNTGKGNSGLDNAGNDNAGYSNAGYSNAGNYNAGNYNAGNSNAGNSNAGNYNAGYSNAGNDNAGYSNAGNDNAGNYNAGNYNAGNRNAGYSNAGNDNAGAFNNIQANYVMFNKPSNWTYEDFTSSRAYELLSSIETTLWVPEYAMSEQEKKENPYFVTTKGYVKHLPYKESFSNAWNNWNNVSREAFTSLPNFDWEVFTDITGVEKC